MDSIAEFFAAVELGDLKRVRSLLAAQPELARARDADGATALHHAAFHAYREIVTLLLANGAELNARDNRGRGTPTGWAIHYLRELGGLLAIEIDDALYAIQTGNTAWVRRLVTRDPALLDAKDANGKPLAEHARESGNAVIADLFASEP